MLKLPEILSGGMILRHNAPVTIWGETDEESVEVVLDSRLVASCGGGKFEVTIPAQQAGGPHTLTIRTANDTAELCDVYFGEVWLAGGQSNMEYHLRDDSELELARSIADVNTVRQFTVPQAAHKDARKLHPENYETPAVWVVSNADTCGDFSAVAWWAAINYSEMYGIPVGIIYCNWGGTSASCWISREDLAANEAASLYVDDYNKAMAGKSFEDYVKIYTEYYKGEEEWRNGALRLMAEEGLDEKAAFSDPRAGKCPDWPPPHGPWNFGSPANLYEGMLTTVIPYSLTKILWYQGEEDIRVYERYYELLKHLIACFRKYFRDSELPFYIVQIAPYAYLEDPRTFNRPPYLREIQSKVAAETYKASIVITTDCGNRDDIHPKNKRPVGERLCNIMCAENGEAIDAYSPKMTDYEKDGSSFILHFDKALRGESAKGFLLCDENRKWHFASGSVSGNSVTVTSDEVSEPVAARYAFANYIYSDLYGENGLPVEPCRTDSFLPDEIDMSVCMEK